MNAILDKLKQIPARLLEFWKKYTSKQKTLIVCIVAGVFLLLVGTVYFISRPEMEVLIENETTAQSSEITKMLDTAGIKYNLSRDSRTIYVNSKDYSDALLCMADNGIPSLGMTLDELFDNTFSTTESEKTLKANIYKQDWLRSALLEMDHVEGAIVAITPPSATESLFEETQETSVAVFLTVDDEFQKEQAKAIANIMAGAVGNKTTDNVTIVDQNGRLLFSQSDDLLSGNVSSMLEYQQEVSNLKVEALYKLLLGIPAYDDAKIVPNLSFDMDQMTEYFEEYSVAEGNDQGYLTHDYIYEAVNATGSGGTPGTSSNDGTDYMIETTPSEGASVEVADRTYQPNKRETNVIKAVGALKPEESSMAINLISYHTYNEKDMKAQGLLEGQSFDDFILANEAEIPLEVSEEIYSLVSNATGIDVGSIQILAWEVPVFQPIVSSGWGWSDYLMIILAVLIIALLIFVVFKGSSPVEVTEMEPELSVEQLLATTKENQSLDDIEFSDKSETRRMIEKFVDENPDAVAQLLRNWLSDEWG